MSSLNALADRLCGVKPTYHLLNWTASLAAKPNDSQVRTTKRARVGLDKSATESSQAVPPAEDEDSFILDLVAGAVDLSLSSDEKP